MAHETKGLSLSYVASADYKDGSAQYRFVSIVPGTDMAMVLANADATGPVVGVCQDKPRLDQASEVTVHGESKVVVGVGGITAGALITSDATGRAVVAAAATTARGICVLGAAEGQVATVLLALNPTAPAV